MQHSGTKRCYYGGWTAELFVQQNALKLRYMVSFCRWNAQCCKSPVLFCLILTYMPYFVWATCLHIDFYLFIFLRFKHCKFLTCCWSFIAKHCILVAYSKQHMKQFRCSNLHLAWMDFVKSLTGHMSGCPCDFMRMIRKASFGMVAETGLCLLMGLVFQCFLSV